jgi:hypothetical protein
MSKVRFTFSILAVAIFSLAIASVAQAQATRTWVSGVGDDVNPCSRTAPCKTYAGAISKTARDGEISTLDPGGFGAITITKSITINGTPGSGYGSILASGTNGVIVNITDAADTKKTVRLNWLDINGATTATPGLNGIRFLAGNALHVENTNIDAFSLDGIEVAISSAQSVPAELYVKNASIRNCLSDGVSISHGNSLGVVVASFTDSHFGNNGNGMNLGVRSRATVRSGTFHANSTAAINLTNTNAEATLFNCSISNSPTGIIAGAAPGIVRITQTLIYGNSTSLTGNVKSWGNNYIDGNTTNNLPVGPNLNQS